MTTGLKREDDRQEPGLTERVVMVVSFVVTVALFGFTIYHAVTAPTDAEPTVTATVVETTADGVIVEVELRTEGSEGFRSVTVEVMCDTPPPEVMFEHVPVDAVRRAEVLCPPGTTAPGAQVSVMVPP